MLANGGGDKAAEVESDKAGKREVGVGLSTSCQDADGNRPDQPGNRGVTKVLQAQTARNGRGQLGTEGAGPAVIAAGGRVDGTAGQGSRQAGA
jgi:hypothetical protein